MIVMQKTIDVVRMYAGISGISCTVAFCAIAVVDVSAAVDNELSA